MKDELMNRKEITFKGRLVSRSLKVHNLRLVNIPELSPVTNFLAMDW